MYNTPMYASSAIMMTVLDQYRTQFLLFERGTRPRLRPAIGEAC